MQGKEMTSRTQQSSPHRPATRNTLVRCEVILYKLSCFLDTLDSSHAMVLLPLACEPLEYLRGRFSNDEKHQDRVCRIYLYKNFVWHTIPASSCAGSKTLPDRAPGHTKELWFRYEFCNGTNKAAPRRSRKCGFTCRIDSVSYFSAV